MNQRNNLLRLLLGCGAVCALFTVVSFAVPFAHTAAFWAGYAAGMLAFAVMTVILLRASRVQRVWVSRLYGIPLARMGVFYLVYQLVVSLVSMAAGEYIPMWPTVILSAVGLTAAVLGWTGAEYVQETVERQEIAHREEVSAMRTLRARAEALQTQCTDAQAAAALRALADELRYSDPVSSAATLEHEEKLNLQLGQLGAALQAGNTAEALALAQAAAATLRERNIICKNAKI